MTSAEICPTRTSVKIVYSSCSEKGKLPWEARMYRSQRFELNDCYRELGFPTRRNGIRSPNDGTWSMAGVPVDGIFATLLTFNSPRFVQKPGSATNFLLFRTAANTASATKSLPSLLVDLLIVWLHFSSSATLPLLACFKLRLPASLWGTQKIIPGCR